MIKNFLLKFLFYSGLLFPSFFYTIDHLLYGVTYFTNLYLVNIITIYIIIVNYILLYYFVLKRFKWIKELIEGEI